MKIVLERNFAYNDIDNNWRSYWFTIFIKIIKIIRNKSRINFSSGL